jgi:hypothetical protein
MLTRLHGKINIECDACGEVLDTETRDFNEALQVMRAEGWVAEKIGDDWSHYCPACDHA